MPSSSASRSTMRSIRYVASGRPAQLLGGPGNHRLIGVEKDLGAEAAAYLGRDHADLVLGQPEDERGHQEFVNMRILTGGPHGEVADAGIVTGDGATWLYGVRD